MQAPRIRTENLPGRTIIRTAIKMPLAPMENAQQQCLGVFSTSQHAMCDVPKPNPKKPKDYSTSNVKPSKGMSLSIPMWTGVSPHEFSASVDHQWKFYTTKVGKAVGNCGETKGAWEIKTESSDKPAGDEKADNARPPFPRGTFKLSIEDEACTYKCDGTNAGRLFCPKKVISCVEDSAKSKPGGMLKCGDKQFHHAVVYCDF
jgi:hypothetical protein